MVAEEFIDNPECKPQVAHSDGNPRNNVVTNLRWATPKENNDDKRLHGTAGFKLTFDDAQEIRRINSETNIRREDLAALFNVSRATVYKIVNNIVW